MTPDQLAELGNRAVACKGWRWMPGMLSSDTGLRLDEFTFEKDWEAKYPDLTDPATLGCLRHLAAEVHGAWEIVIQTDIQPRMEGTHGWWRAVDSRGRKIPGAFGTFVCPNGADLKAFALVCALESYNATTSTTL